MKSTSPLAVFFFFLFYLQPRVPVRHHQRLALPPQRCKGLEQRSLICRPAAEPGDAADLTHAAERREGGRRRKGGRRRQGGRRGRGLRVRPCGRGHVLVLQGSRGHRLVRRGGRNRAARLNPRARLPARHPARLRARRRRGGGRHCLVCFLEGDRHGLVGLRVSSGVSGRSERKRACPDGLRSGQGGGGQRARRLAGRRSGRPCGSGGEYWRPGWPGRSPPGHLCLLVSVDLPREVAHLLNGSGGEARAHEPLQLQETTALEPSHRREGVHVPLLRRALLDNLRLLRLRQPRVASRRVFGRGHVH
mmetsp:Transcript_9358/g.22553  ORF Transcript_9358/g.22553 Transcript_9358/m.22553 type:complete len:305 (-) Transcript_9358:1571-2485(-)